jgi:hypothetical protein
MFIRKKTICPPNRKRKAIARFPDPTDGPQAHVRSPLQTLRLTVKSTTPERVPACF